jgi:mRNA-degrading endonuclease RelE of RelBE toxin-antitoxin system
MTIIYKETADFLRDLKKLRKRFRTLDEDLIVAKTNAIELYHIHNIDNHSVFSIPGFKAEDLQILKLKKFACKALKGKGVKSGIRIIYAFFHETKTVEFIEIYFKGDQENEDRQRVNEYLVSIQSKV